MRKGKLYNKIIFRHIFVHSSLEKAENNLQWKIKNTSSYTA
jgi:hypothetical protein